MLQVEKKSKCDTTDYSTDLSDLCTAGGAQKGKDYFSSEHGANYFQQFADVLVRAPACLDQTPPLSSSRLLKLFYYWQRQSCQRTMSLNHCLRAQAQISASRYNRFWVTARLWVFNWCNLMSLTSNEVGWIRTRAFLWGLSCYSRECPDLKWPKNDPPNQELESKQTKCPEVNTAAVQLLKLVIIYHHNSVLNDIHLSFGNPQCQEHGFVILRSILMLGLRNL